MNIGDLIVNVGAKIDGFKTAMADVSTTAGKAAGAAEQSAKRIETSFTSLAPKMASLGMTLTAALTLPMVGLGAAAIKAAADMESLKMGLNTITHNSAETEKQLARLKEVAKIPGLDFQGAVKGSINLQAAGFSAQLAERALKAFGNALAAVGKGREDLEGVNLVLTQILNKPKVMAQDLNQLRERLPQISQMMKAAFGTNVSEDIQKLGITGEQFVQKIITEFEKLPPVASGLKNTFENVRDSGFQALAKLGDGLAPLAMRFINVVVTPMISAITGLAEAFNKLPGPVQNAALALGAVMIAAGPVLAIVGRLGMAVKTMGELYVAASAIMTTRVIPALFGTQAATTAVQTGTLAMTGTFTAFGSTATAATAAATTGALSLQAALGGIVLVLGAVVAGYLAWKNIKDSIGADAKSSTGISAPGGSFHGFYAMPGQVPAKAATPSTAARVPAEDYVNSLIPPRPSSGGMDPEKVKEAFSNLGLKDLEKELAEATAAFNLLTAAHKLNDGQVIEATKHINDLRGSIAEMRAGYKEVPKATVDLLKTLGVDFQPEAAARVQEMGAALTELSQRVQAFVGPQQNGVMDGKLAEAWQRYAHAVATADDEMKKHIDDVPWLNYAAAVDKVDLSFTERSSHTSLYIKTEADLNEEMRQHLTTLRELPEAHRPVMDVIMDALGAIRGVTDAYHYFNIQTPADLAKHAAESKRQYEIIKNAAGDAAVASQIAWHKSVLAQIELDHALGDTDQELYEQRKRMAEDALKHLEGESKKTGEVIKKDRYDLGRELEQMSHRTFDSMERDLARNIVTLKGWKETGLSIVTGFAEDFLSIMFKGLFKPLEDAFAGLMKNIGGVLGGIFGGGGGAAGVVKDSTAPGGVLNAAQGGGAAGAAGSSVAGIVGAVGSVVSAVSGVIGNFQFMGMNKSLDVLVNHTLRIFNELFQFRADAWDRETHLMAKLDDMWRTNLNIYDLLGAKFAGAGGSTFTFNIYGATDPKAVVDEVAAYLKAQGVYV